MRDPDLVLRAQRAATALERAWERYRTVHGLDTGPLPPVSSYVGYSLEEPWGQPRAVFGLAAEEAEQLAVLLDRHECGGPADASAPSLAGDLATDSDRAPAGGHPRVPVQSQPRGGKRVKAHEKAHQESPCQESARQESARQESARQESARQESARQESARHLPVRPISPGQGSAPEAGGPLDATVAAPGGLGVPAPAGLGVPGPAGLGVPGPAGLGVPGPAGLGVPAEPDLVAFRPRHHPPYLDEDHEANPLTDPPDELDGTERAPGRNWTGRSVGSHALPRQKRPGAGGVPAGSGSGQQRAGRQQEGAGRMGGASIAAELAGWASSELPGQAAHWLAPRGNQ